jgi:hypothetical protein
VFYGVLAGVEVLAGVVDEDVNLPVALVDLVPEPRQDEKKISFSWDVVKRLTISVPHEQKTKSNFKQVSVFGCFGKYAIPWSGRVGGITPGANRGKT